MPPLLRSSKTLPRGVYFIGDPAHCHLALSTWRNDLYAAIHELDHMPWRDNAGHVYTVVSGTLGMMRFCDSTCMDLAYFGLRNIDGKVTDPSGETSARVVRFKGSVTFDVWMHEDKHGVYIDIHDGMQSITLET